MGTILDLRKKIMRLQAEGEQLIADPAKHHARIVQVSDELDKATKELQEYGGNKVGSLKGRARVLMRMLGEVNSRGPGSSTEDNNAERDEIVKELRDIQKEDSRLEGEIEDYFNSSQPLVGAGGADDSFFGMSGGLRSGAAQRTVKGRDYRSLFGAQIDNGGWNSFAEFSDAVHRGLNDDRLSRAGLVGSPSDGGFLLPTEYSAQLLDNSLESEIVRPRATVYPMTALEKKVAGTVIGDHSASLYGGVISYWEAEAATMTEAMPKFRSLTLTARKLTNYGVASSEWFEDVPGSEAVIQDTFSNGLGFYLDKSFLTGTGAGQPLGVMNAPCLISCAAEGGQAADTVQYENLTSMVSRLHPACFPKSVWVCHPTLIPSLLELQLPVGTGGSWIQVLGERNGLFTLLTRPVIFSEKMEVLGDKGDILLADFSQYIIGLRKDIRLESSIHVKFASDEIAFRCILRADGMPSWDEALTLSDGTTTVGPFVTLAERA